MLVSSTCITVTSITEKVMAHLCAEPRGPSLTESHRAPGPGCSRVCGPSRADRPSAPTLWVRHAQDVGGPGGRNNRVETGSTAGASALVHLACPNFQVTPTHSAFTT